MIAADGTVRMAAPNCLAIGQRRAALGLLWQPLQPGLSIRDQARLAGGNRGEFDLHVGAVGSRQAGFGATGDGLSPGMLAGATAINADGWGDNWVAAFRLPGQAPHWWIVAMRGAQIYEDQLHGAESAARQAMEMSLEAPDWDRIIAPPAWAIDNSQDRDVADALDLARAAPLQRVNRVARMAGIAALVMAAAILAGFGWSRLAPVGGTGIASLGTPVPAVESYDYPWENAPSILAFVRRCTVEMDRMLLLPPGWLLESLICSWSGQSIGTRMKLRRNDGRAVHVRAAAGPHSPEIARKGDTAELAATTRLGPDDMLTLLNPWRRDRLETVLRDRFGSLGLEAGIHQRSERIDGRAGGEKISRALDRFDLGIHTSAGVLEYARLVSDIPALVPDTLAWRQDAHAWHLTARAYPEPPPVQSW